MILNVHVEDQTYPIEVPPALLEDAAAFFDKMDQDMDNGWQMSREWVESPTVEDRCRIVADRLLTSLNNGETRVVMMMAGYILSRMPQVNTIRIDTAGEVQQTELLSA